MIIYGRTPNQEYETLSRYKNLRVLIDTKDNQNYLETYNQKLIPEDLNDLNRSLETYHVVKQSEAGRLDMISLVQYGTITYWWLIALANNCIDPFTIKEGDILKIPSLTVLSDYRYEIAVYAEGPTYVNR